MSSCLSISNQRWIHLQTGRKLINLFYLSVTKADAAHLSFYDPLENGFFIRESWLREQWKKIKKRMRIGENREFSNLFFKTKSVGATQVWTVLCKSTEFAPQS